MENKNYFTPYSLKLSALKEVRQIKAYMEKISALPNSIKMIMTGSDTADYLEDVLGPTFNLSEEQVISLTDVVHDILCGTSENAGSLIAQRLGVDQTIADKILLQLINGLLAPAIEDIKRVRGATNTTLPQARPQMSQNINPSNIINLRKQTRFETES